MIQKLRCEVERVVAHGGHVYTLVLKPERIAPRFRPGQFLHLALDTYEPGGFWPDSRAFSIASSQRDRLSIAYSVRGRFTERMEADLAEGREVWVKLPYGRFVVDSPNDVVLFAGGTGITAFTAFLEGVEPDPGQAITLAYGARTPDLLIYREFVERCAGRLPTLAVRYFVERLSDGAPRPGATETAGRLSVDAVWPALRRPLETAYYLSGPPAMLQTVSSDLRAHGVGGEAINIDAWE